VTKLASPCATGTMGITSKMSQPGQDIIIPFLKST